MLDVTCATGQRHGPLTVFPLIARESPELPLVLMAEALGTQGLRITELGSGTVPELLATNLSERDVLSSMANSSSARNRIGPPIGH